MSEKEDVPPALAMTTSRWDMLDGRRDRRRVVVVGGMGMRVKRRGGEWVGL